jgi:hypothetical protein
MVGIHIDANYIFCETMKNRTEGEMINAYQKRWIGCYNQGWDSSTTG